MKKNGKELIVKNFNIISVFAKDMLCKNSKKYVYKNFYIKIFFC